MKPVGLLLLIPCLLCGCENRQDHEIGWLKLKLVKLQFKEIELTGRIESKRRELDEQKQVRDEKLPLQAALDSEKQLALRFLVESWHGRKATLNTLLNKVPKNLHVPLSKVHNQYGSLARERHLATAIRKDDDQKIVESLQGFESHAGYLKPDLDEDDERDMGHDPFGDICFPLANPHCQRARPGTGALIVCRAATQKDCGEAFAIGITNGEPGIIDELRDENPDDFVPIGKVDEFVRRYLEK